MGNENSGRRSRPTALKLLRGVTRKDRLNPSEPQPPAGAVVKPPVLSRVAGVVWDRVAPICIAMGTLTTADTEAFGTLCELQASLDMASRAKDAPEFAPFTDSDDYDGAPKMGVHGALLLELKYAPIIRPFYEKFGLEPAGRSRIQIAKTSEAPKSKWAGLL